MLQETKTWRLCFANGRPGKSKIVIGLQLTITGGESIKSRKNADEITDGGVLPGSIRRFPSVLPCSQGIMDGATGMEECPWH